MDETVPVALAKQGMVQHGEAPVSLSLSPSQLQGSCIFQRSLSDASGPLSLSLRLGVRDVSIRSTAALLWC